MTTEKIYLNELGWKETGKIAGVSFRVARVPQARLITLTEKIFDSLSHLKMEDIPKEGLLKDLVGNFLSGAIDLQAEVFLVIARNDDFFAPFKDKPEDFKKWFGDNVSLPDFLDLFGEFCKVHRINMAWEKISPFLLPLLQGAAADFLKRMSITSGASSYNATQDIH